MLTHSTHLHNFAWENRDVTIIFLNFLHKSYLPVYWSHSSRYSNNLPLCKSTRRSATIAHTCGQLWTFKVLKHAAPPVWPWDSKFLRVQRTCNSSSRPVIPNPRYCIDYHTQLQHKMRLLIMERSYQVTWRRVSSSTNSIKISIIELMKLDAIPHQMVCCLSNQIHKMHNIKSKTF